MNMTLVLAAIFVPQANEKWYDLGGSLGFLSTTFVSLYYPTLKAKYWEGANVSFPPLSSFAPRQQLLTAILVIWTARLGSFLVQASTTLAPLCDVVTSDPVIPRSAQLRLGETHVLTRSSIRLGPLPPSGWPRVCLRINFFCVFSQSCSDMGLFDWLARLSRRSGSFMRYLNNESCTPTGEYSPRSPSPCLILPRLCFFWPICRFSSL